MDAPAVEPAVGPGEVDELEQAQAWVDLLGRERAAAANAGGVDDHHLAGLELADEVGADDVEGRGLRCQHPAAVEPAEAQRAEAVGVAHADDAALVGEHEAERARQLRQHHAQRLLELAVVAAGTAGG